MQCRTHASLGSEQRRNDILRIAAQYGRATYAYSARSRVAMTARTATSILVDMDPDRSLLDVVGLGQDLEELVMATGCDSHRATEQQNHSQHAVILSPCPR